MKPVNKYKTLALANESFNQENYEEALRQYAQVLQDYPESKEAFNGAILAEMAMSGEEAAEALFDYYEVLREEDAEQADTVIAEILQTMDGTVDQLTSLFNEPVRQRLDYEDGILYDDFRQLVREQGDFKTIFENIMFSTRVLITEKEEFIDFLSQLNRHGYHKMAMNYIETALSMYPNDDQLRALLRDILKSRPVEDSAS
jgi:tetratricopeptide (TPR) repeat protein